MEAKELIEKAKIFIDEHPEYKGIKSRHHAAKLMADFCLSQLDPERTEEYLAKYWYDTEYCHIDKTDHKKAEESRRAFRKWIDENLNSDKRK